MYKKHQVLCGHRSGALGLQVWGGGRCRCGGGAGSAVRGAAWVVRRGGPVEATPRCSSSPPPPAPLLFHLLLSSRCTGGVVTH